MNYATKDTSRIIGLSIRQLDYWDRTHFIKPSVSDAAGRGSVRLYCFSDLIQLRVARGLIDRGVTLQKVRKSLHYLRRNMPDIEQPLSELQFLTDGETIFVLTRDKKVIIDTLRSGQVVFSIALGEMVESLKGEVVALQRERKYEVQVRGRKITVCVSGPGPEGFQAVCTDLGEHAAKGATVEEALDGISGLLRQHLASAEDRGQGATGV